MTESLTDSLLGIDSGIYINYNNQDPAICAGGLINSSLVSHRLESIIKALAQDHLLPTDHFRA